MLKVAIIGYGKMGHEVEKILHQMNVNVGATIDNESEWTEKLNALKDCDVAIEFSMPELAIDNFKKCIDLKIPVVSGTTGWYTHFYDVINLFRQANVAFIYGSNFSIGANLFFATVSYLSKMMNKMDQYRPQIDETHHITKKDAPSGTAITTADLMITQLDHYTEWISDHQSADNQIPVFSHRVGEAVGEHHVTFSSNEDTLTISHRANNRVGFAVGAVKSAIWLINNPGIYSISEIYTKI
jgi:4-hydroxy-tetrahydrodipicolinate reductase